MASYTASQNGDWSSTSTWGGLGVPGNGDTVITSYVITVSSDTTVGASNGQYASAGNPAAIQLNSGGKLILNAGLIIRGDLVINTGYAVAGTGITFSAGAGIEFDSSTTSPNTTSYGIVQTSGSNCPGFAMVANGTQAKPCYLRSNPGGAVATVRVPGGTATCGNLDLTWFTFTRFGASSAQNAATWYADFNASLVSIKLNNVTFDTCGGIFIQSPPAYAGLMMLNNVVFKNSLGTANINIAYNASFKHCVFDLPQALNGGVSVDTCYFGQSFNTLQNNYGWAKFTNSFVRTTNVNSVACQGNIDHCIIWMDTNTGNPHYLAHNPNFALTMCYLIFGYSGTDGSGDTIVMGGSPASPTVNKIHHILGLPNAAGNDAGTACSMGGSGVPNLYIDYQHCTVLCGDQGLTMNETQNCVSGSLTSFKNNIMWDSQNGTRGGAIIDVGNQGNAGNQPIDVVSPVNCDYNCTWGVQHTIPRVSWYANQGRGYIANFSSTPGVHDKHVDPQFVDATRNVETFDSAYLGNTAPAWSSYAPSHAFAVGDTVSDNNAAYYSGAIINYRCILPHVKSSSGSEPGASPTANWRTYWEFSSAYSIRNMIAGGSTGLPVFTIDSTLGLVNADGSILPWTWIWNGFAPQNSSLMQAGCDGSDIGAVPVSAANQALTMLGCG